MSRLLLRRSFFMILVIVISIGAGIGCSSNDPEKSRIEGFVVSVNGTLLIAGISVIALNPDGRTVSSKGQTNEVGAFSIGVNNESGLKVRPITLVFTTQLGNIFSEDFLVPRNSTSTMSVTLAGDDVDISDGDYTVFSRRIGTQGSEAYVFSDIPGLNTPGMADFIIDGNGNTCLRARDNSTIVIEVDDFTATNCEIGVRSGTNAGIDIDASDDFVIISKSFGVRSADASSVFLSGVDNFSITSSDSFGIGAINTSSVDVNDGIAQPTTCSIVGGAGDIETLDLAEVTVPANCL